MAGRLAALLVAAAAACTDPGAAERCDPLAGSLEDDVCNRLNGDGPLRCELYQCDPATSRCLLSALDRDRDGEAELECGGTDCDDRDDAIGAGKPELCDRKDNDCNDMIDDAALVAMQPEQCNDADDDCDTRFDEEAVDAPTWRTDGDGDGHAPAGAGEAVTCDAPGAGWSLDPPVDDCDDGDDRAHGDHAEECDGIDNDCNGGEDETFTVDGIAIGGTCAPGEGACERTGTVVCDGLEAARCTASPGDPVVDFQTEPAPNGSWDWNCDGTQELEHDDDLWTCGLDCSFPMFESGCKTMWVLDGPCEATCGGSLVRYECVWTPPASCSGDPLCSPITGECRTTNRCR